MSARETTDRIGPNPKVKRKTEKMIIYNTDTNELIEITCGQCDTFADLSADDDNIAWNKEEDRYEADGETIAWWQDYVRRQEEADDLLAEARRELDEEQRDELRDELEHVWVDFESGPEAVINTITSYMDERGFKSVSGEYGAYFEKKRTRTTEVDGSFFLRWNPATPGVLEVDETSRGFENGMIDGEMVKNAVYFDKRDGQSFDGALDALIKTNQVPEGTELEGNDEETWLRNHNESLEPLAGVYVNFSLKMIDEIDEDGEVIEFGDPEWTADIEMS